MLILKQGSHLQDKALVDIVDVGYSEGDGKCGVVLGRVGRVQGTGDVLSARLLPSWLIGYRVHW